MILLVAGTRPEVVKLAPVYFEMKRRKMLVRWVFTGQQEEIGRQAFEPFGIEPEISYGLNRTEGDLIELNRCLSALMENVLRETSPSLVVVQGDTLTAAVAGMQAFLNKTPMAHVEAGLRSWDVHSPFPEEAARVWLDAVADLKFAPTQGAALTLNGPNVWVTGNTEIDALRMVKPKAVRSGKYAVVTVHRRENLESIDDVCEAVRTLAERGVFESIVWPVHPNPAVTQKVKNHLDGVEGVELLEPLPYDQMVNLTRGAAMLMTDSGGMQEQALALNVPCLVLRNETERPEGVQVGGAVLVGTNTSKIVGRASWLMSNPDELKKMIDAPNPYGDGKAAERIALVCKAYLEGKTLQAELGNWSGITV